MNDFNGDKDHEEVETDPEDQDEDREKKEFKKMIKMLALYLIQTIQTLGRRGIEKDVGLGIQTPCLCTLSVSMVSCDWKQVSYIMFMTFQALRRV